MQLIHYRYRAVDPTGRIVSGRCDAATDHEAKAHIRGEGLEVVSMRRAKKASSRRVRGKGVRITSAERSRLTANLYTVVSSHVPLSRGLRLLSEEAENERVSTLLSEIKASIDRGQTLTEALGRHPEVFPPVYVAMVGAGESSGALEDVLLDLKNYLDWQDDQRRFLRKNLVPPAIVICGVMGLIGLLILFVVPSFEDLFLELQLPLPAETEFVFGWSRVLRENGGSILAVITLFGIGTLVAFRNHSFRLTVENVLHRVPVAGALLERIALMRFSRNFQLTVRNGIALATALHQCADLVGSEKLRQAVLAVEKKIVRGSRLAEAMKSTGAFPNMVVGLVTAGEESGQLAETLQRVHGMLEREVQERFSHLLNLVTPLSTLFLGLVVGGVAVTLLSTLFSLYSAVGS